MVESVWEAFKPLEELRPGTLATFRANGHQCVVARTDEGDVFALENRCPHEGYPLADGDLKGCHLTCCWHNWKFDVRDGACVLGGEGTRSFPTRVRNGAIEIDVSGPDPAEMIPAWRGSMNEGIFKQDSGRAVRDVVRMLQAGYDPHRLLADIARYDALHAEYGSTHVLAHAADACRYLHRYEGAQAAYPITPVIELCGDSNRRLPARKRVPPERGATAPRLRAAVEEERADEAEALIRGAFEDGIDRSEIESWVYACMSDHFTDFGHQLIYQVKLPELLDLAGDEHAADLWGALVFSLAYATREDTLPYMRRYWGRMKEIESEFAGIHAGRASGASFDAPECMAAVLDGSPSEAFEAVWGPLKAGVPAIEVAKALVGAGAERLLRFDLAIEQDPDVAENWLWATHRFTFSSAVRNAIERFDSPEALRFLFQAMMFIHTGRGMDLPEDQRVETDEGGLPALEEILGAAGAHASDTAVKKTAAYLREGGDPVELRDAAADLCLKAPLVRPIVVTHAIKTLFAAFEEYDALNGHVARELPVLAAIRFLASPVAERRTGSIVHTSLRWVVDGVVPRKLTQ